MKTHVSKSILAGLTLAILIMTGACKGNPETGTLGTTTIEAPEMDIHTATVIGDLEVIRQHIKAGTNLDEKEPVMESTPLISAAVFGKTEVARALVEAGAEVNYQNREGSTALHTAAFLCRLEIVKLLLENGADKDLKNVYGSTALVSVAGPFEQVRPIYEQFSKDLGPLGLKLDYAYLEETRPVIAEMLR